jgi:hypothetical protein
MLRLFHAISHISLFHAAAIAMAITPLFISPISPPFHYAFAITLLSPLLRHY